MPKIEVSTHTHTHTLTHTSLLLLPAAMNWMNVEEMLRRAEAPLFWVGAFTVACLALWLLYRLLSGFRIWVLGNGQLLSPKLGKWAGELGHINCPRSRRGQLRK